MLWYSDDVKVAITKLQERLEVPVQIGISIQQVAQQAMNENGEKIFEVFLATRIRIMYYQLGQMERRSGKAWSTWKENVKTS